MIRNRSLFPNLNHSNRTVYWHEGEMIAPEIPTITYGPTRRQNIIFWVFWSLIVLGATVGYACIILFA